jgi:hypothetical protein
MFDVFGVLDVADLSMQFVKQLIRENERRDFAIGGETRLYIE